MSWQNRSPFSGIDNKVQIKDTDRMPFVQPTDPYGKPIVFVPYDFSNWEADRIQRIKDKMGNTAYNDLVKDIKEKTDMPHQYFGQPTLKDASPYSQGQKFGFVSTSDGRMGFLAEDYKSHTSGKDNTRGNPFWIRVRMKDGSGPELNLEYFKEEDRNLALQELCDILHQNKNS